MMQEANAQEGAIPIHCLITISHPNLATPITVTSDAIATVSNGVTFNPFPFVYQTPDDRSDQVSGAKLQVDNTDLSISTALHLCGNLAPDVLMQIVMGSTPNTIEAQWALKMRTAPFDVNSISMGLRFDEILDEPYPGDTVNPATLPAVSLMETI